MADNKKQHYLSQFYLRRFSAKRYATVPLEDENKIYRLDKTFGKIAHKSISGSAFEPFYYSRIAEDGTLDHSLEKKFSDVESAVGPVFEHIDDIVAIFRRSNIATFLRRDELEAIYDFVLINLGRVPNKFEYIKRQTEEFEKTFSRRRGEAFSQDNVQNLSLQVLSGFTIDKTEKTKGFLRTRRMIICHVDPALKRFIASDVPVFFLNNFGANGLAYETTEVFFPISSDICLVMLGQDGGQQIIDLASDLDLIDQVNRYQAKAATRYVFSDTRENLDSNCYDMLTQEKN